MIAALGTGDHIVATVRGPHFGNAIAEGEPIGNELAAAEMAAPPLHDLSAERGKALAAR
jgi:hypothetical protein